jgi:hypothetical protein
LITSTINLKPSNIRKKDSYVYKEFAHNMWQLSSGRLHCKAVSIPFNKVITVLEDKEDVINKFIEDYNI